MIIHCVKKVLSNFMMTTPGKLISKYFDPDCDFINQQTRAQQDNMK